MKNAENTVIVYLYVQPITAHILRLSQVIVLATIEMKHEDVICENPGTYCTAM